MSDREGEQIADSALSRLCERALDLADQLDAFAEGLPWPGTASRCHQTASSLRWQVRWERKHPRQIDSYGAGS